MSASVKYAASGFGIVAVLTLALWPFLDPAGRSGVLIAAAVAVPVQVIAFTVLLKYRGQQNGFLAAWAGGTLVRMAVIGIVAVVAIRSGTEGAIPMLLALAGFFFGPLLLEPIYFKPEPNEG